MSDTNSIVAMNIYLPPQPKVYSSHNIGEFDEKENTIPGIEEGQKELEANNVNGDENEDDNTDDDLENNAKEK